MRPLAPATLALALTLGAARPARGDDEVGVGMPAPAFALRTLDPDTAGATWLALDAFAGEEPDDPGSRLVLLAFFASWCGPCEKELPVLQRLHLTYGAHGLRVIGIDVDSDRAGIVRARALLAARRVTFPVLSDPHHLVARRYLGEAGPIPSIFLVGRDGVVVLIERGYVPDLALALAPDIELALGFRAPTSTPASAPTSTPATTPVRAVPRR